MSNPFFTSRKAALEEEEASRGVLDNSEQYLRMIDAMPYQTPALTMTAASMSEIFTECSSP